MGLATILRNAYTGPLVTPIVTDVTCGHPRSFARTETRRSDIRVVATREHPFHDGGFQDAAPFIGVVWYRETLTVRLSSH
jgi:hypothetical protein